MADQTGASLAGRDYFHGNRSIYNFDRFDQWRNGRIGDGLLILTMGSVLGAGELAGILCGAFLLCGIYSGIEYLMLKKRRIENTFCTIFADRIFWRDIFVRKMKKGSFTIEAALLMPLVLMILMSMLYLDFFVHDRGISYCGSL